MRAQPPPPAALTWPPGRTLRTWTPKPPCMSDGTKRSHLCHQRHHQQQSFFSLHRGQKNRKGYADIFLLMSLLWAVTPPNLTHCSQAPCTPECDFIWKQLLQMLLRCDGVRWVLTQRDQCLYKKRTLGHRHTRRTAREDDAEMGDACTSQGTRKLSAKQQPPGQRR